MNAYTMSLAELTEAVARCQGYVNAAAAAAEREGVYDPVTRWEDGGPIITAYRIALRENGGTWYAMHGRDVGSGEIARWSRFTFTGGKRYGNLSYQVHNRVCRYKGGTPLEAAMRAYVGSIFPVYENDAAFT